MSRALASTALFTLLISPVTALAHIHADKSVPAKNAVLTEPPQKVEL